VTADTPTGRVRRWATELLRAVRPEVRVDAGRDGTAHAALAFPSAHSDRDVARLAAEVFALPGRIAAARRPRLAVALDEFQAIAALNGGSVEPALRAAVQDQRQVGYVFVGSEPSLMERMLTSKRPFYKAGPVIRLEKIPPDDFAAFLETRFAATGLRPEAGSVRPSWTWPAMCPTTSSASRTRRGTTCGRSEDGRRRSRTCTAR
jgi:hypothetical protein